MLDAAPGPGAGALVPARWCGARKLTAKVVVRPATAADIAFFAANANLPATPTILAWVGELADGADPGASDPGASDHGAGPRLIGIGGFAILGGHYRAFVDLTPEAQPYKMTLMRTARRVMAQARRLGVRHVYAEPEADQPGAARWLESLGFVPDQRSAGMLYRWQC